MILDWRNSESVKKYMYNSDDIQLENHLNFIEKLKDSTDKLYFLVQKNDEYIGVIDFTNISSKSVDMGLYTNPNTRGNGKVLMTQIINYSFNILKKEIIYAEVFEDNQKAFNLYKNFGFKQFKDKIMKNKKIICMELRVENR
jgi:UDP-4-amino-4,6-dideoxy-N-acetyl-beta-L-altrosamine N-acetyltransferase